MWRDGHCSCGFPGNTDVLNAWWRSPECALGWLAGVLSSVFLVRTNDVQGKIKAMETELASMRESVTELEDSIRGLEEQNRVLRRALGDE